MKIYETDLKKEECVDYDEAVANTRKRSHLLFSSALESLTGKDFIALEILKCMIQNPAVYKDKSIYEDSVQMAERFIKELYPVKVKIKDARIFYKKDQKPPYRKISAPGQQLAISSGWVDVTDKADHYLNFQELVQENV